MKRKTKTEGLYSSSREECKNRKRNLKEEMLRRLRENMLFILCAFTEKESGVRKIYVYIFNKIRE